MPPSREEFWDFSLEIYATPGVKEACLEAQDCFGADVNLLLLLLWHDRGGLSISDDGMRALLAVSSDWQQNKLRSHRARRRAAKGTGAYEGLLREELALERQAQDALVAACHEALEKEASVGNSAHYLHSLGAPSALLTPLLAAIRRV
jgi:uncharacterized protein (TIGR02444 family)